MRKLLVVALVVLAGCATQAKFQQNMNSYIGASEADLVSQMGPPRSVYAVDDHTKVLTWSQRGQAMMGNVPVGLSCDINMTVVDGRVQRWSARGNECVGR